MYLLYVDDAGSIKSPDENYFVLAGICIFERQVHYLNQARDELAARIYPEDPEALEFHGSHMLPGKGVWRSFRDKAERRTYIRQALETCRVLRGDWALFGMVIEKRSVSPHDPMCLIQFADLTAYALFQKYERHNTEFFDVIKADFDSSGGIVHGLLHQHSGKP